MATLLPRTSGFGKPPATGVPRGLAQPEFVLPAQMHRSHWWRPEHTLWAMVLHTAALEAQWPDTHRRYDNGGESPRHLARDWVTQRGEHVGGFTWVCQILHLNPDAVAHEILVRGRIGQFGEIRTFHRAQPTIGGAIGHGRMGRKGSAYSSGPNWTQTKERR